ncbi:biopolymer transporter ExbD [Polyangium sp. 6x1]|uniref:ExbD/TolR family protein n=1 Tax=Polyangium sp. 6x1 TaxID=3042689 RepID=UPI002482E62F|nr:biopolymer transporter ExbD [Polyangium sp. 6x1]MDI1448860.1 biopolymer transporter ExbD [Polyangium sp. 6x1]
MAASSSNNEENMVEGINVTPLVDITLVLLIIFMVTAKIIVSQALPLDLPKAASGQEVQMVFSVELRANGDMVIDGKKLPNDDAALPLAKEAQAKTPDLRAVIRAEQTVQHGRVLHALDLLKRAGITKIAFGVTPVPAEDGKAAPAAPPVPVTP